MNYNLKKVKISDAVEVTDYVANGSFASLKANVRYLDNSSPNKYAVLVRTLDFNRNWNGEYVWVDKAGFDFLKKSGLRKDDLVLCNVGSVGIVFEVPDLGYPMTLGPNSLLCRTKDVNLVRQKFLYYYFLSFAGQALLHELSGGSTVQPKFNKTLLRNSEIEVPDLAHQDLIIKILGSIDSKISLNEALSKTLEDIAQTIFISWFIDFDPVKAKMAGEKPSGMDAVTAALFPDSMVESEAGLIPSGWEVSELISLVDSISDGDWIESKDQSSEGYRLLQIGNIGLGEFVESGKERYVSQETFKRLRCTEIMPGDVLVARMPDPTGRSWFVDSLVQPAITSVDVAIIRAHPSRHSNRYVSMFLNLPSTLKLMESLQTGSTRQRIKRSYIETLRIIAPNAHVLAEFEGITEKLFGYSDSLRKESRVLKGIRDSLLPRLISGELQIPEEMLTS